ncbi:MAG: nuclease-related domain-containing protein [Chthoniobacteraceae bacterium]
MDNLVAVGVFVLIFALSCALSVFFVQKGRGKGKLPFNEKMLRPPGHSLRVELEKMDNQLLNRFIWLIVATATASLLILTGWGLRHFHLISVVSILLGASIMVYPICRAVKLGRKMMRYRVGLLGEQVVGEHLNQLMRQGCAVFHDVPGDGAWNIDHVVVSAQGVFAIETKTYRKPEVKDGHKVTFTGSELQFAHYSTRDGLEQAARNAKWLAQELTKATGEPVTATPILTLPGWMIERRGKNGVFVLNPREISQTVLDARKPLIPESNRQRIAYQLERLCRTVEV